MTDCDEWMRQFRSYCYRNCQFVQQYLKQNMPKITASLPKATTLMWVDFSQIAESANQARDFCIACGVLLSSGTDFCNRTGVFCRLNVGSPLSVLKVALERIKAGYDVLEKE